MGIEQRSIIEIQCFFFSEIYGNDKGKWRKVSFQFMPSPRKGEIAKNVYRELVDW